jgi:phosphatidylinositol glycan class B
LISSHSLALLCSRGYFQFDEHYQVLEFIQWKLGLIATVDMPWELRARMRPWLHPALFFPLEWISHRWLGWSPFLKTTLHRACVAAFALFVIARRTRERPELLALYATQFFFPFLDVRMSAEVIGGWLFALGYALDDERADARPLASFGCGLLFGLAAVIRLQVLALWLGLWLYYLHRREFGRCFWIALGLVPAFGLGALLDRWGYGAFSFVPWNYVYQNIVLGKAVHFGAGALPWYWYVSALLEKTGYLPGAILLAALVWQWLRRPLDKLSFISAPFVLLHVAVAHKELRFLFPLAPLMPEMLFHLWEDVRRLRAARFVGAVFVALNLMLLAPASLHDANPDIGLYAALYSNPLTPDDVLQYINFTNPLSPYGLHPSYYLRELGLRARPLRAARKPWHGLLMFDDLTTYAELRAEARCRLLASRYPSFVLDRWPSWLTSLHGPWISLWSLWRCP